MVRSCSAYGCTNRWTKNKNIQFHRFPLNDPERLLKWIISVRRKSWKPTKNSLLCSEHFTEDSYKSNARHFLKDDAVPSIFAFSDLQETAKRKIAIEDYSLPVKKIQKLEVFSENVEPIIFEPVLNLNSSSKARKIQKHKVFSENVEPSISEPVLNLNPSPKVLRPTLLMIHQQKDSTKEQLHQKIKNLEKKLHRKEKEIKNLEALLVQQKSNETVSVGVL